MKLILLDPMPGDKQIIINDLHNPHGLSLSVDYDDVDHETVLKDALELVSRVNYFNSVKLP